MNSINRVLPELLAPAGSAESAAAAIAAGADAIYFGSERFNARARAKNLSAGEISDCLRECRARGIKAYGAINTRLRDGEVSDGVDAAWEMLSCGTDALIVADLGLAEMLKLTFPEAVLHASTQITGTCSADAAVLESLGFSRMVCPRELSLSEVRTLVKKSPIGIEMFIHGAHCVSVSGQCSMSYVMGGRSGNRGDCAGPCRLPFGAGFGCGKHGQKPRDYALSLKDMCLASHICEIIDSGAVSLKIEGRLKGPEYTYGVVKIYRELLDGRRDASPEDIAKLAEYFSRDGFSDGYLCNRYGNMLGTKKDFEVRRDKVNNTVPSAEKVRVSGNVRLYCGDTARLTLNSPEGSASVEGDILSRATGNPPSEESVKKSLSKLGNTPFVMDELTVDTDGICGISASALNGLRREAVEKFLAPSPVVRADPELPKPDKCQKPVRAVRAAVLASADQFTEAVEKYFDEIYIPSPDFSDTAQLSEKVCLSLPEIMYEELADDVRDAVKTAVEFNRRILVHTLGELAISAEFGASFVCSHRFAVYNSYTAQKLRRMGADVVTLSPEVSVNAAKTVSKTVPVSVLTGGRMPLMLCRRCPMSDGGKSCRMGRAGGFDGKIKETVCRGYLTDRTGAVLPTVGDRYCMTSVYNSVPTWTELDGNTAAAAGITQMMYVFSAETPNECNAAVKMLESGTAPTEYRKLR